MVRGGEKKKIWAGGEAGGALSRLKEKRNESKSSNVERGRGDFNFRARFHAIKGCLLDD